MCAHALWGCWQLSEDDTHTATLLAAGCMQVTADGLGSRADGVREVCAGLLGNLLRSVAARESALALQPPVIRHPICFACCALWMTNPVRISASFIDSSRKRRCDSGKASSTL